MRNSMLYIWYYHAFTHTYTVLDSVLLILSFINYLKEVLIMCDDDLDQQQYDDMVDMSEELDEEGVLEMEDGIPWT